MEKWAEVKGSNGVYFVSDQGRIKSVSRQEVRSNGVKQTYRGKILHPQDNGRGYAKLFLRINGEKVSFYVHRLVAEAFIPNPDGLPMINHKDFNPSNNNVSNLEWTTHLGNMRYSIDRGRFDRTDEWRRNLKRSLDKKMAKSVIGTRISDGTEIRYTALNDCARDGFQPSCVCYCCKGKLKQHKGYTWRYADAQRDKVQENPAGG